VEEPVEEGIWKVTVTVGDGAFVDPGPRYAVVVPDQMAELGTLSVLGLFSVESGPYLCYQATDCLSTETCESGSCVAQDLTTPYCLTATPGQCTDTCAPESCGFDGTGSCSDASGTATIGCLPASATVAGGGAGECKIRSTGEVLFERSGC
jgi:hypothetical protein